MTLLLVLALAAADPFAAPPVPDPDLASERGGFRLPSGIEVAMTVDTRTAIDGAVVLRTVLRADQGSPTITAVAGGGLPAVTWDARNGVQVNGVDVAVRHLAGSGGLASVVTNSGNDRVIETETNVTIDLSGTGPDVLGSAMLRTQALADDAVRSRF